MRRYQAIAVSLLILMALCPPLQGRQDGLPPGRWLLRARRLTDELLRDADALGPSDRALLWARLGEAWWHEDVGRARAWMLKAVETVEAVPSRERASERGLRLKAARELLSIVTPKDPASRARLLSVFDADAARQDKAPGNDNAEALMGAALAMLRQDPRLAAEFGAASLRAGYSPRIPELLWGLRVRDPKLADALFTQALAVARASYDGDLLNSLRYVAFTDFQEATRKIPEPPEALKADLLKLYLEYVGREADARAEQSSLCGTVAAFVAPLLPHYERLLPQRAAEAREATAKCRAAASPHTRQRAEEALREQPLNTVEALLEAAARTDDVTGRASYRFRAAQLAAGHKDLTRAVEVLDLIDSEGRKVMGGMWEKWRAEWAAALALEALKHDDFQGMHRVMGAAPPDLHPFVNILFAEKLPAGETRAPAEKFIEAARRELGRAKLENDDRAYWYVRLVRLYAKHVPLYAPGVLREAVAAINLNDKPGSAFAPSNDGALADARAAESLPPSLLDADELAALEIIGTIESPVSRAQARLSMLKASLEHHRESPAAKRAAPKKVAYVNQ